MVSAELGQASPRIIVDRVKISFAFFYDKRHYLILNYLDEVDTLGDVDIDDDVDRELEVDTLKST